MIKQLWTCVILCLLSVGAFAQGSGPKTFNLTAASQCATITTDPKSTSGVYIQVSGTWSATLQAEVGVGGNPPVNVAVTPTTSQTQQSNITANGGYNAAVAGPDLFQLCVSSYVSGTAVVWLSATTGVASNALSGGGGGGGGSGTVTTVNSGTGLTGGPISVSGTLSIANTAVTPGSYTSTNLTVNQQGQITAATSGTGSGDTVTSPNSTISVGGSSSATTIDLAGSAGEIMAGATPALTSTPTFGQSGTAGTLSLFPASGNFTSKLGSAATANNTINFFATVPTTGDLIDCVTSGAVCTLTDSGVLTSNVVTLTGTQTLSNKTLTAPALGTPASGVITNLTGTCTSCTSNNSAEIGGIGVTGTPSLGYIPTATSSSAATWQAPTGGGNVSNTGTPTSNQIGVWTGATTLSGSNYDPYGIRGTVDTRSDTGTYAIGGGSPNACGRVQDLAVNSALISATGDQSSSIWACGAVDFDPLLSGGGNQIFFGSGNGTVGSVYSTDIGFHSDSFLSYTGFPTTLVTGGSPTPASSGTAMVASANFPGNTLTMSGTSGGATATLTSGSATSDTMLIAPGTRFIFSTGTDHTIYRVVECNVQAAPCYAISTSVIPAAQCTGTTTGCFSQFYSLAPSTGITISFVPNLASSPSTTGVILLAPIMEIGDALGVNAASQTGGTGCGNCNTSLTAAQISNVALSAGAAGGAATCAENIFGQENSWFQNMYITNCAIGMIWEGPGAGGASTVHSGPTRNVNINYNGSWSGEWGTTQPIIPMEIDGGEEEFDRFTINDVNIGSGGVGASQLVYGSLHITNAPGSNYGHGGNITFNELHIEGCVNTVCGSSTVASGQQDAVLIDTLSGNGRPASVTGSVIISNYNLCPGTHSCVNGVHVASTFQGSLQLSGVNCLGPQSTTQGTTNIIKDDINGNTMTCANNLGGSGFYNIDAAGTAFTSFNCTDMTLGWCLYNGTWAYYSAGVATTKLTSGQIALSGTTHGITIPAGTASSGASGSVVFASDATNGYAEVNENNNGLSRVCTASNGICSVSTYSGVSPIAVTGTAISLQNSTPANVTTAYGTDTAYFTGSGGATTSGHSIIGDANGGIEDSGSVNVTPSSTTTFTNKSIAGSEINSGLVASTVGGTGVNNSATLTLGTSNRNYATLGTGFEYNTTTTGAVTDATAAQLGALINLAQWDVLYSGGTAAAVAGAAINGFQYDSTSGAPAAATAANLGSLINIAQYDVLLSGGTSAAPVGVAPSSTSGFPLLSQGASSNPAFAAQPLAGLATQTANTVVANVTGSTAAPTAASIPSGIQNYVAGTGYNQGTAHQIQVPAACGDTSASGTAQSCNTSPTFTPATSDCVTYTTTTANTGTGLTVNINSMGVKSVAIPGASGWTTTLTPSIIPNNTPLLLCYAGTNWNVQQTGTVVSTFPGTINAASLLATGIVDGTAPITITTGTTANLGATYNSGYTFNQEGTAGTGVTYTLPATAVGKQYCVQNSGTTGVVNTGVLTVYPPASSFVILNGTVNTVGGGGTHGVASGGAAGDSACFVAIDATHWEVFVGKGTWSEN